MARIALRASVVGDPFLRKATIIADVDLFAGPSPPVAIELDAPLTADDPSISANGAYVALFAEVEGDVDLYRVFLDTQGATLEVLVLTPDVPNPCVIGETCAPPSVDTDGDVVWSTSEGAIIHTSTDGGIPTHTSLLPDGVTGRLPALSPNGRFVTYTSPRTDLQGSGADRVFVADAPSEPPQ